MNFNYNEKKIQFILLKSKPSRQGCQSTMKKEYEGAKSDVSELLERA